MGDTSAEAGIMQSITKRHLSVHGGITRFAEVTVAVHLTGGDQMREPELFLNGRRIISPNAQDKALVEAAVAAVQHEAARVGRALRVVRVESFYVDAHPEAAREAALSAVAALLQKNETRPCPAVHR